jgi:hypothetical protein
VLHGLIFRTKFLLRHVCSSTRSYTDFPVLVKVAAERERGASVQGQRKCSQTGRPKVDVTWEKNLEGSSREKATLQRSRDGRTRRLLTLVTSGVPRNFVPAERGGSTNSVEDRGRREWGSGGSSPLVRGSGGSCNLVQEISFHIVNFS